MKPMLRDRISVPSPPSPSTLSSPSSFLGYQESTRDVARIFIFKNKRKRERWIGSWYYLMLISYFDFKDRFWYFFYIGTNKSKIGNIKSLFYLRDFDSLAWSREFKCWNNLYFKKGLKVFQRIFSIYFNIFQYCYLTKVSLKYWLLNLNGWSNYFKWLIIGDEYVKCKFAHHLNWKYG